MTAQNRYLAHQIVGIIDDYYRKEIDEPVRISMKPLCFCVQEADCTVADYSPITVPNIQGNCLQIHINATLTPLWYPNQLLYQYSHELWHAYEFSLYGINYPWQAYESHTEPYAYAASLCTLAQKLIPSYISDQASQEDYFAGVRPEKEIYAPGAKLAEDASYSLRKLYEQYRRTISPQVLELYNLK